MYSIRPNGICISLVSLILFLGLEAHANPTSKARYTKRGHACKSLRHMTRKKPELRERVQRVLFQQREAEKVCRAAFRQNLPGVDPKPKAGSICQALTEFRDQDPSIKAALTRARRLERQAHARCSRMIKRLKTEVPKRKAAGMR